MNSSNYRTRSLEDPRRVFLWGVVWFMLWDVLWILGLKVIFWVISVLVIVLSILRKRGPIMPIFLVVLSFIWYFLWSTSYENRYREYTTIIEKTNKFTYKWYIEWEVLKMLYRKERSNVYLFNFDNFDNFDKFLEKTSTEAKTNVENRNKENVRWSKNWNTLLIEVPSNLSLSPWDRITFSWKIQPLLEFPLNWYHKYAFFHRWYGYIFVPQFNIIKREPKSIFSNFQNKWEWVFKKSFPREVAGVALGMTIGSTKHLTEWVKDTFLLSGVTHILVVSWSNIAFLILILTIFTKYLHFPTWVNSTIITVSILLYVGIVGWEIPVLRATLMGILSYLIASSWLKTSGRALFWLVLLILTIIEPLSPLYDAWYWLSFGATMGIILFQKHTENFLEKHHIPRSICIGISLSFGATIWSIPVLLYHFWSIPLYSLITNILISWFLWWILLSSTIFWWIGLFWLSYIKYFWVLVYVPIKIIISIAWIFSKWFILSLEPKYAHIFSSFIFWVIVYYFLFDDERVLYSK